ncbi:MAG: HD domain-containing protein [Clostridiales bacterium]|nr:HD domain-containing protein [Clostridiales bacterium]
MLKKAIGSKVNISKAENPNAVLYMACVGDLLENSEVRELDRFEQHIGTSRLQHSLNVSYYSFLISKFLHCDYRSAARAGILHDLFFYDWHTDKTSESHVFRHPKEALRNAEELTDLNDIEKDAIINHMFPLSSGIPRYKESYVVSVADKYSAALEFTSQMGRKVKKKLAFQS